MIILESQKKTKRRPIKDLTNKRFGRLLVIGLKKTKSTWKWECKCDCGNIVLLFSHRFYLSSRRVDTKKMIRDMSCGCYGSKMHSPTYECWRKFIRLSKTKTCNEWRGSFRSFIDVLGPRPDGFRLIRINKKEGYNCGKCVSCTKNKKSLNCEWVPSIRQFAKKNRINENALRWRLRSGGDIEAVVSLVKAAPNRIEIGYTQSQYKTLK